MADSEELRCIEPPELLMELVADAFCDLSDDELWRALNCTPWFQAVVVADCSSASVILKSSRLLVVAFRALLCAKTSCTKCSTLGRSSGGSDRRLRARPSARLFVDRPSGLR